MNDLKARFPESIELLKETWDQYDGIVSKLPSIIHAVYLIIKPFDFDKSEKKLKRIDTTNQQKTLISNINQSLNHTMTRLIDMCFDQSSFYDGILSSFYDDIIELKLDIRSFFYDLKSLDQMMREELGRRFSDLANIPSSTNFESDILLSLSEEINSYIDSTSISLNKRGINTKKSTLKPSHRGYPTRTITFADASGVSPKHYWNARGYQPLSLDIDISGYDALNYLVCCSNEPIRDEDGLLYHNCTGRESLYKLLAKWEKKYEESFFSMRECKHLVSTIHDTLKEDIFIFDWRVDSISTEIISRYDAFRRGIIRPDPDYYNDKISTAVMLFLESLQHNDKLFDDDNLFNQFNKNLVRKGLVILQKNAYVSDETYSFKKLSDIFEFHTYMRSRFFSGDAQTLVCINLPINVVIRLSLALNNQLIVNRIIKSLKDILAHDMFKNDLILSINEIHVRLDSHFYFGD